MRVGDLMTDMQLLKEAQTAANIVLEWEDEKRDKALVSIRKQIDEKLEKEGGILN